MPGPTLDATTANWTISALATAGIILRPFSWPEAIWAVGGALALLAPGLIGPAVAWAGVSHGPAEAPVLTSARASCFLPPPRAPNTPDP